MLDTNYGINASKDDELKDDLPSIQFFIMINKSKRNVHTKRRNLHRNLRYDYTLAKWCSAVNYYCAGLAWYRYCC